MEQPDFCHSFFFQFLPFVFFSNSPLLDSFDFIFLRQVFFSGMRTLIRDGAWEMMNAIGEGEEEGGREKGQEGLSTSRNFIRSR